MLLLRRASIFILFVFLLSCAKDENSETPSIFYDIEVISENGGSVDFSGGSFKSGSTITLTATPNQGFIFSGWSNGSTQNPLTLEVNSNQTISAQFSKERFALKININGEGEVREEIINTGKNTDYESGTTIRLTPIPSENWSFYRWNNQIPDTTSIKEIEITEAKTVDVKFDYASGKKLVGQWELGSINPTSSKTKIVSSTFLVVDYALNFFIVKSNNDIIDQQEIDNAKYGIIDPTSPTEFKLNFGKINITDPPVTNDLSSTISLKMPSEDFGGSIETFEMQIIIDDKSVDLSVDKASLSVPKADDGTIAPPTLYSPEIGSSELLEISESLIEDLKIELIEIVDDDTLFPEVCLLEITSATLTSNNDDDDIDCDEDIKVKIDFGTDVLAPVELIMTDKDGNDEFIGMTPTVSTPATAIDLTTDKFSQWEVNITRDGALNWVDVSSDNTITLTVSNSCYVGTEELVYDLLGDCADCEEITSATLTSNNDDDDIDCDEDIKVKIDFGTDVLAPVELIMTDKDGNDEFIGMTPTVSTPATAIDLTTDKFSQWEVNITRDGALNWVDVSSDNTITLTVSNSCYVGTEELVYDLLGDCADSSTATATVSYQVRSTDLVTYVTQTPDNYGKVYCGDVLKFNVTLPTSHNGSVHLKLAYSDGTNDDNSLVPVGGLPTADWTIDGISLAEGKYGDVATLIILDYTTLDEEVLPSDLVLDYQEGLGCIDDCDEITSATLTSNNDDDDIECDEDINVTVDFNTDVLAPVKLNMTDSFGNIAFIEMTPVTSTPSSSIDFTIDKFSEWEVNISKAEETEWSFYSDIDLSSDNTVKLTVSNSCYTGSEEIIVDLIDCIDESLTTSSTIYNIGVNASSSSDYSMNGNDLNGTVTGNDPSLTFNLGDTINFNVDSPGHPFYLKTAPGTGTGDLISGVTNNGATEDTVTWIPSSPGTYYYQCSLHSAMTGTITIL